MQLVEDHLGVRWNWWLRRVHLRVGIRAKLSWHFEVQLISAVTSAKTIQNSFVCTLPCHILQLDASTVISCFLGNAQDYIVKNGVALDKNYGGDPRWNSYLQLESQ